LGWDWSCYSKLHHRLLYHHPLLKGKKKLHSRGSLSLISLRFQQAAKQQRVTQEKREPERAREEKERVLEA
jgi:hypothetical protein